MNEYTGLPFYLLVLGAVLVVIVILLSRFASWEKKIRAPSHNSFKIRLRKRKGKHCKGVIKSNGESQEIQVVTGER